MARSKGGRELKSRPPLKDPVKLEEMKVVESEVKYQEKRPILPFFQTRVGQNTERSGPGKGSTWEANLVRDKRFKRLRLGNMIVEFDKVFDFP